MRDHRPTLTSELVGKSRLGSIQQHAENIIAIQRLVTTMLPKGTEKHCRVANIRGGFLILEVASAAIKHKLNFERLTILNQLRTQGFAKLTGIDIEVNPELYVSQEKTQDKPRDPISPHAAACLNMVAQNASPKVKARLESLAKLANKK